MKPVKEVEFDRLYDAPIEAVWQAWTDPAMLKQWWGPDNVSIPECTVDLSIGGEFYIVMEAGEAMGPYKGTRWPMRAKYTIIDKPRLLSYSAQAWTEGMETTTEIDQLTEIKFTEQGGKTRIQLKATINKAGPDAKMAAEGMQQGFGQQLDKLTDFLSS